MEDGRDERGQSMRRGRRAHNGGLDCELNVDQAFAPIAHGDVVAPLQRFLGHGHACSDKGDLGVGEELSQGKHGVVERDDAEIDPAPRDMHVAKVGHEEAVDGSIRSVGT